MRIEIDLQIKFGKNIPTLSEQVKKAIVHSIDTMTGINLFGIDINITSIVR